MFNLLLVFNNAYVVSYVVSFVNFSEGCLSFVEILEDGSSSDEIFIPVSDLFSFNFYPL